MSSHTVATKSTCEVARVRIRLYPQRVRDMCGGASDVLLLIEGELDVARLFESVRRDAKLAKLAPLLPGCTICRATSPPLNGSSKPQSPPPPAGSAP